MENMVCVCCGYDGPAIAMHHIDGKKNSDRVVPLCFNCHQEQHGCGLIIVQNEASRKALAEIHERMSNGEIFNRKKEMEVLNKYGYDGLFDSEREEFYLFAEHMRERGLL